MNESVKILLKNPFFYLSILSIPAGALMMNKGMRLGLESMGKDGFWWEAGGILLIFGSIFIFLISMTIIAIIKIRKS